MTTPASPIVTPIPSTAPVDETATGPSAATAEDVFFLDEEIKDDNVLDIGGDEEDDGSSEDDSSEKKKSSSEEESR